jgi:hypothetical protein
VLSVSERERKEGRYKVVHSRFDETASKSAEQKFQQNTVHLSQILFISSYEQCRVLNTVDLAHMNSIPVSADWPYPSWLDS